MQYNSLEKRLTGLFNNCGEIWASYKDKHEELKEVYGFLKLLSDNLKDMSLNIKNGENCDELIDSILKELSTVINDRELQDTEEQKSLLKLKDEQKIIMKKFVEIKEKIKKHETKPLPQPKKTRPQKTRRKKTPGEILDLIQKKKKQIERYQKLLAIQKHRERKVSDKKGQIARVKELGKQRERIRKDAKKRREDADAEADRMRRINRELGDSGEEW